MAGDWIKFQTSTPDKPEVIGIARILGIDQDAVVGKLVRIWIWADQQLRDGNAARATRSFVDRATFCAGFAQAMVDVGWLRDIEDGIEFPNFDRHNGQTAKTRALTKNRVATSRTKLLRRHRNGSVTESLPEKRREEKSTKGDKSPLETPRRAKRKKQDDGPLPDPTGSQAFLETWGRWIQHRSEIRAPLKPTMAASQLTMLAAMGEPAAIAMIEHTIAMGWRGLRKPEPGSVPTRKSRVPTDEDLANWNPVDGGLSE